MADDTRQSGAMPGGREIEVKEFKALPRSMDQEIHRHPRAFIHRPNEDPAVEAEARRNASVVDAAKTIQLEDFTKIHQTPCVRNAMLPGIGGGATIGAARFVLGGSILASCNWASATFVGVSLVMYQFCQRRRTLEKENVMKAVKVLDAKQALKEAQAKGQPISEAQKSGAAALTAANAGSAAGTNAQPGSTPFWSTFKFW